MPLRFNKNKRYTQNGIKFGKGVWEDSNDKKQSFYPPGFGYEVDRKTKTVVQLNSDGTKTKIPYEEWAEKQLSQNQLGLIKNDRKYAIPVVKDKMMTISIDKDSPTSKTRGITFSENLLDSIALNAKKAGLPFSTAIGIVAQESMFGNSKGRQPGMTPFTIFRSLIFNIRFITSCNTHFHCFILLFHIILILILNNLSFI